MTALLVLLMFVGFALLDLIVRVVGRRMAEARERHERESVLATSLRLDFTSEATTLKRVEVDHPKARILAVDDEPVILDSFRKVLVLEGYSIDTVETGPDALGLVQRRDYDLVFTDLKMPGMDGTEVVKGVKQLRPDVDVVVVTGYGTIESAVETLKHGAIDYVQKPFTAEELVDFVRRLVIRRQARLEAQRRPSVRIASPELAEAAEPHEYCVPGGAFLSAGHTWARIEPSGEVRTGLDDFARKGVGSFDAVRLPQPGLKVKAGDPLFSVKRGRAEAHFPAPVGGRVVNVNARLEHEPALLGASPYDRGWICKLAPADLATDLRSLRIGQPVVTWYQEEIARLREVAGGAGPCEDWSAFEEQFLMQAATLRN